MRKKNSFCFLAWFLFSVMVLPLNAQVYPQISGFGDQSIDVEYDEAGEFNFVRIQFDTYYGQGFGFGTWSIDFPDADMNFLRGVSRLTNIRVMSDPIVLRVDDEEIFDYPFLYMLEVGQGGGLTPVSYTHLTLPTILRV